MFSLSNIYILYAYFIARAKFKAVIHIRKNNDEEAQSKVFF